MFKNSFSSLRIKPSGLYLGWWINIVTGLLCGIASGFVQQGSSVFFKSISSDLALNRAATSVATGVSALQSGSLFPFVGWFADKFGPRWIVLPGMMIMITGLILMNYISSPWQYYLVWGLIVSGGNTMAFTVAMDKMLTSWFISKRGLAFGIRFTVMGTTMALLLPFFGWLSVSQGWRTSCLIWAGVVAAGIPFAWHFVKQERPEYYGLLPDGARLQSDIDIKVDNDTTIKNGIDYAAKFEEHDFSLSGSLKTTAFWLLALMMMMQGMFWGFSVHTIPFLTDMDFNPITAASVVATTSLLAIPARLFSGIIADHIPKSRMKFLLVVIYILSALGFSTYLFLPNKATTYILLIFWQLENGAFVPMSIVIISRYFGRKYYGSIQGLMTMFSIPFAILAPVYAGRIYDVSGSYHGVFILFAILGTVCAVIMCLMRAPKFK